MGFGSSTQKNQSQDRQQFEPVYLRLSAGDRIVRILDEEETVYWRYWLPVTVNGRADQGRSIVIGSMKDSPIAKYMASIGEDHPQFRKVQKRMLLNSYDRTPVKKNNAGIETYPDAKGIFPSADANGERLDKVAVVPNNRVLVIDFGPDLMEKLAVLHNRVRDQKTFEPLPIWRFDVTIVTSGVGKDVSRVALPGNQDDISEETEGLLKYKLSDLVTAMPVEAQQRLLDGDDYLDIIRELGWERPSPTVPVV